MLRANAHVLRTRLLRPLRTGVPMLAATLLATATAFMLPQAMGEPESSASLIALRLLIATAVGVPTVVLLLVTPSGLFGRARSGALLQLR